MLRGSAMEVSVMLYHEQREYLTSGKWTDWHPLDLNNAQAGLSAGQRFQRRVNGKATGVLIFDDTPGAIFAFDREMVAP